MKAPARIFEGYVFDLDGTVYLGDELLPGAGEPSTAAQAPDSKDG